MKIWANCIVHNEENFIWYAIMSVIDYVDKVLVWDSGSTDKTVEIIEAIKKEKWEKIEFKEIGPQDKYGYTKMRQAMLEESACDWILILDGDEVWWRDSIKQVANLINTKKGSIDAIVSPFYNMVGDVYHYQSEKAGKYEIAGKKGHLTIRAINRQIPGLHLEGPYGEESYSDGDGVPIQKRDLKRLVFTDSPFMHLTHLKRTSQRSHRKFKIDRGIKVKKDFLFPEVFYLKRPVKIISPWKARSRLYEVLSLGKKILKS